MARSVAAFSAGCLVWFAPMLAEAGGAERYFGALGNLWWSVPAQSTVAAEGVFGGLALGAARLVTIGFILFLTFGFFPAAALLNSRGPLQVEGSFAKPSFGVEPSFPSPELGTADDSARCSGLVESLREARTQRQEGRE